MKNKTFYFDMDGTICNLYGQAGWLEKIRAEMISVYRDAEPFPYLDEIIAACHFAKKQGFQIGVISWSAKDCTNQYHATIKAEKKDWLVRHNFPFDSFRCVRYGVNKSLFAVGGVLIDDDEEILADWRRLGRTGIHAQKEVISERIVMLAAAS